MPTSNSVNVKNNVLRSANSGDKNQSRVCDKLPLGFGRYQASVKFFFCRCLFHQFSSAELVKMPTVPEENYQLEHLINRQPRHNISMTGAAFFTSPFIQRTENRKQCSLPARLLLTPNINEPLRIFQTALCTYASCQFCIFQQ